MQASRSRSVVIINLTLTAAAVVLLLSIGSASATTPYTARERNLLPKLRLLVEDALRNDYEKSDTYLIRWLRASGQDIDAASEKLLEAKRWRKMNRIDGIENENILNFTRTPYTINSVDKKGRPVLVFAAARMDTRKLLLEGKQDKIIRYYDQMIERVDLKIRATADVIGDNITQAVDIFDFSGYNLKQHGCLECLSTYVTIMQHYETYFPGLCKTLVFVNLPRIGVPLLEALRPVMSPATRKALSVFGPNKNEFAPFLLKIIAPHQLPYSLGGVKKGI